MAGLLALSLFVLLRRQGFYPLHAAGLAAPKGAGVLLIGASGAGKSTIAYSLVRQGWASLSDDSVLLRPGSSEAEPDVEALPFRRKFGLAEAAKMAFPEVAAAWGPRLGEGTKRSLDIEALYPGQVAARCLPRLLVFPEVTGRPESELRAMSKSEAMHATVGQSALVTLDPEHAPRHLKVLSRLTCQTRHVRLLAGRDLRENPRRVAELIGPMMP